MVVKPRSLNALRREAAHAARQRGHRLRWSLYHSESNTLAFGCCTRCEAQVTCNPHPLSNETAIGGEAVAIICVVPCGCCGHYHRPDYDGDCRNDAERFTFPPEER